MNTLITNNLYPHYNPLEFLVNTVATLLIIAMIIFLVISHIIISICEMKALKFVGYKLPVLAWIPFVNQFIMVDACKIANTEITIFANIKVSINTFKWGYVLIVCAQIMFGTTLTFLLLILYKIIIYSYFLALLDRNTAPKSKTKQAVAAIFLPIILAILFIIYIRRTKKYGATFRSPILQTNYRI